MRLYGAEKDKYRVLFAFQAKQRFRDGEDVVVRPRTLLKDREQISEEQHAFVMACRRLVEKGRFEQTRDAENRLGEFMAYRFEEYIPLKHHLMMYQEHNIIKQYSELTPESELIVYNLYTEGQGHTEDRITRIPPRKSSSKAKKVEEVLSDEDE